MGSLKVKVKLENGFKVTAFLDTGAEINIITTKVIEDTGFAIQHGL